MAKPSLELITALRTSAERLRSGARYEWGHVGRCNCGHLVQSVCEVSDREIFQKFADMPAEWSEHANDYCGLTGMGVEDLFGELGRVGFTREDVKRLEFLSDPRVLKSLPESRRYLNRNERDDVVLYMDALAGLLESELELVA